VKRVSLMDVCGLIYAGCVFEMCNVICWVHRTASGLVDPAREVWTLYN
jgi:hypothetical protein